MIDKLKSTTRALYFLIKKYFMRNKKFVMTDIQLSENNNSHRRDAYNLIIGESVRRDNLQSDSVQPSIDIRSAMLRRNTNNNLVLRRRNEQNNLQRNMTPESRRIRDGNRFLTVSETDPKRCPNCHTRSKIVATSSNEWICEECEHVWGR